MGNGCLDYDCVCRLLCGMSCVLPACPACPACCLRVVFCCIMMLCYFMAGSIEE